MAPLGRKSRVSFSLPIELALLLLLLLLPLLVKFDSWLMAAEGENGAAVPLLLPPGEVFRKEFPPTAPMTFDTLTFLFPKK